MNKNYNKYNPYRAVQISNRQWPNKIITKAPTWCSVDLRDGNQALVEPMDSIRKMRMFKQLVNMGFKEIEIGFPSASDTDFNFVRELIIEGHIPDDVTVQVLTQSREPLIIKTIESLKGCENAIIHLYNSTSTLQREVVFKETMEGVKKIATDGAKIIADNLHQLVSSNIRLQYSPESFTGTELPYALEVCENVLDVWQASIDKPVIINLPERHPYAGSLVHTAFSGSHQDAIRKGMDNIENSKSEKWAVPYLPIDPADIGRTYEAIIRVNSQSGKGGTAWLLETDYQVRLPKGAEIELSASVQKIADKTGNEITSNIIWQTFNENFIVKKPFELIDFKVEGANRETNLEIINAKVSYKNRIIQFSSQGNGPISAFVNGVRENFDLQFTLEDFGQNTRSATSKAESAAYVELKFNNGQNSIFGCGIDTSITVAPIIAVISAINKNES